MNNNKVIEIKASQGSDGATRRHLSWLTRHKSRTTISIQAVISLALALLLPASAAIAGTQSTTYTKTVLASDLPGTAPNTDPNLVNPWGLSHSPRGPWVISANGSGQALTYNGEGVSVAPTISIPSPSGQANGGTPTGNVFNPVASSDRDAFVIQNDRAKGPSTFMFATEDGTIAGWNKRVNADSAIIKVDRSTTIDEQGDVGAVYKGLAFAEKHDQPFIYATNFRFGTVEMFDKDFNLVKSFTDTKLTNTCPLPGQCFAPFGIQNIDGNLYVTFALQDAAKHDDQAGPGNGFVDVFSPSGRLIKRLIAGGNLNSPWGLALAPSNGFGEFGNSLLVGNFGDGTINAYDVDNGKFDGTLKDQNDNPIQTDGLWGIAFGNNGEAGKKRELFFTAGINHEADGVFGKITKN